MRFIWKQNYELFFLLTFSLKGTNSIVNLKMNIDKNIDISIDKN